MRNFCELIEHVVNQCRKTKNVEKRFDEMLTRMDNLERNMSELIKLKNTTRALREACTSFNSRIDQAEERIPEVEDFLWTTIVRLPELSASKVFVMYNALNNL